MDWERVLDLAGEHGVVGLVARRLQDSSFAVLPAGIKERLQERMRSQQLFTLSMMAELFRIIDDFQKAGIETILIKGPVISELAYGDAAVRSYVDLDLLVRQEEIRRASERMKSLGFVANIPISAIDAGKIPGEYLFQREGTLRFVELHTERSFRYFPLPMRIDDFFDRRRSLRLDGREVPALVLEDEFTLDCIHGAKHFWERLIWIADVAAIVYRHPEMDWAKVRKSAEEVGAARMVRLALRLQERLFGVAVPAAMKNVVEADPSAGELAQDILEWLPHAGSAPPSLPRRAMFRWRAAGGGISGLRYLFRLSLSPTEEDWTKDGAAKASGWDSVKRPFRLIKKYGQDG